jgi:hypothetical protein
LNRRALTKGYFDGLLKPDKYTISLLILED